MVGNNKVQRAHWFEKYPAAERLDIQDSSEYEGMNDRPLIVDVAGGYGQDLVNFRRTHPDVKGRMILEELQETLGALKVPPLDVQCVPYNFFTPQPIRGKSSQMWCSRATKLMRSYPKVRRSICFTISATIGLMNNVLPSCRKQPKRWSPEFRR